MKADLRVALAFCPSQLPSCQYLVLLIGLIKLSNRWTALLFVSRVEVFVLQSRASVLLLPFPLPQTILSATRLPTQFC